MRVIQPFPVPDAVPLPDGAQPYRNRFSVQRTAGAMPVWSPKEVKGAAFADSAGDTPVIQTGVEDSRRPGFRDLIDIVNPLQHIPFVNMAYRKLTGDEISPTAQFMGGIVYGGPVGAAAAIAGLAVKDHTGQSVGEHMFGGNSGETAVSPPSMRLASTRWKEESRMSGTIPVWGENTMNRVASLPPQPRSGSPLSPDTNFAMLLNGLSSDTHNMS